MNLSKALKEKNKLAGEYQKLLRKFQSSNCTIEGSTKKYDAKELLLEVIQMRDNLINLKTSIHKASEPIRNSIFALSELKTFLSTLESIDTRNGVEISSNYNGKFETKYTSDINQEEMDNIVKGVKTEIELIQDEIDVFNATTKIDY